MLVQVPFSRTLNKALPPMPISEEEESVSWIDISRTSTDLEYLQENPSNSQSLPPSPYSTTTMPGRPRAPTPSAASDPVNDIWPTRITPYLHSTPPQPSADAPPASTFSPVSSRSPHSPLLRSVSEGEASFLPDSAPPLSFARPPKSTFLPDPSQYPDPYPFRPPHHHLTSTLPALSSAGSSSTRSSAYTSSGSALASGDYGHIHVASGDEDSNVGVGITSDVVVQLLANDNSTSSSFGGMHSRVPIDHARWSESYSASIRSRSSSVGQQSNGHEIMAPRLNEKPSYDMGWQMVDERDEVGVSEEETDDDHGLEGDEDDEDEKEEERTSAIVIVEEGRGLIVNGYGLPIVQLQAQPGTTHLLIGSSTTPNAMPAFLTNNIPSICTTLLALDISTNFLGALPPCLAACVNLEELNIAFNPLRVLPVFLSDLTSLRVLIADSTGINTLPDTLSELGKLHTLSIRRNKMHALCSWLCLLPSLQTLYVDGNPFQGPWKALVEPLLSNATTPVYPPSTPTFPLPSTITSPMNTETDDEDEEVSLDPLRPGHHGRFHLTSEEEEETITPERAPLIRRTATSSSIEPGDGPALKPTLSRTRTTPNRAYHDKSRVKSAAPVMDSQPDDSLGKPLVQPKDSGYFGNHEVRRMKSAGDLHRGLGAAKPSLFDSPPPPNKAGLPNYLSSTSSSNLLNDISTTADRPNPKRFASLGVASGIGSPTRGSSGARAVLAQSLWDSISESEDHFSSPDPNSIHVKDPPLKSPGDERPSYRDRAYTDGHNAGRGRGHREGKEKSGRWGFLKKMSMGKMRPDPPSRPSTTHGHDQLTRSRNGSVAPSSVVTSPSATPSETVRLSATPQIDMRFSTVGILESLQRNPAVSLSPPEALEKSSSMDASKYSPISPAHSDSLLVPPSPVARGARRRSFLPIDTSIPLKIPISDASTFVPGPTAPNNAEEADYITNKTPSPGPDRTDQYIRKEEERAREAYMRALRSVMAYLKDMNDLGLSQSNALSVYGTSTDEVLGTRSRRPTGADSIREVSMALSGTTVVSAPDAPGQLRSMESMLGLRSEGSAQTLSVVTTDSNGSSEERKFKDDKGKRAMVVREIVETERTYVKGLQELVDLYIKPGAIPVNVLTGVGSSKETVVPASERKIVFSGVDALFSFHKESFLPALEVAAAPLMRPATVLQEVDADGLLSLTVAKAVGSMFLRHAAFMRMYSSYINNFDNSVQRVKHWSADRHVTGNSSPAAGTLSPSSSTAQLVGLGLTMSAVSAPSLVPEGSVATGLPNLTTGQRKRIRSYLKRCRMNPRHSQLNLEGYLLLPVQRIPRYRLLLEELVGCTPPTYEYMDDPLDRALAEISSLANNMNEGKRESESRRKLVQWQARIRGKFPSPLVQPHRRLIMDGPLLLTRVVRKAVVTFEAFNAQGDASTVQVDCLAPELTPRSLIGILCNDLLVLCRDPSEGQDPTSSVDLWAVLRMQTLPQPASIVHGNALRLVDNKAILYFDAPSPSDALNWYRAINLHIPASKT